MCSITSLSKRILVMLKALLSFNFDPLATKNIISLNTQDELSLASSLHEIGLSHNSRVRLTISAGSKNMAKRGDTIDSSSTSLRGEIVIYF